MKKTLQIKRETVRTLAADALGLVAGGSVVRATEVACSNQVTGCANICTSIPWTRNCPQPQ